MPAKTKLIVGVSVVALVAACVYFWKGFDDGPETSMRPASPPRASRDAPPAVSSPMTSSMPAPVLELREPEATKARQLLREEQEAIRQMMLTQHRTFIDPSEVESIRSETDQRFAQLLDKPTFDEYMDYRSNEVEYDRIDRLDRELASHGGPGLSRSQRDSLLAAMKEEKEVMLAPQASGYSTQTEFQNATRAWREELERHLQERTAKILSPDQIARLAR